MKLLKIAFAIAFFCLFGCVNSELMAQTNFYKAASGKATVGFGAGAVQLETNEYKFRVLGSLMTLVTKFTPTKEVTTLFTAEFENGKEADKWEVTADGNLIVYQGTTILWQSFTAGKSNGGAETTLLIDNGNLIIAESYNATTGEKGKIIWATGTCGGVVDGCGKIGPRD